MSDEKDAQSNVTSIKKAKRAVGPLRTERGLVAPSLGNAIDILANAFEWDSVLAFDELRKKISIRKPVPSFAVDAPGLKAERSHFLSDNDVNAACVWCERKFKVEFSSQTMNKAMMVAARKNAYHPVRDYLVACEAAWDGKPRLDTWLSDLVQVDDSEYIRAVGAKWMISAVSRAFAPGSQVDHVLVLEGEQRGGKSTTFQALCPNPEWFLETTIELGTRDAYQIIGGKWLVEFAEMGSMTRSETNRIKAFITSKCDTYRKAYGTNEIDQLRTCVFGASVNPESGGQYLKDETGGGRFWPVWTHATIYNRVSRSAIEEVRDALWGETTARWRAGETVYLTDAKLIEAAIVEQDERRASDGWEAPAAKWLTRRGKLGASCQDLVNALGGDPLSTTDLMRAARVFTGLGWRLSKRGVVNGARIRLYKPRNDALFLDKK